MTTDPFSASISELQIIIESDAPYIPELKMSSSQLQRLTQEPQTQVMLKQTQPLMTELSQIPITSYTAYRRFRNDGDRRDYETPYFLKRELLSAAALRLFLGESGLKTAVQDYMWNICEESNWVLPAHDTQNIDLFCAETGLLLAETLNLLGTTLDGEVRHRVRDEVERRVFDPYVRYHTGYGWYKGSNNWNGVCNSSVAATFLLLEPEPARAAYALSKALSGLKVFIDTAFEADGSSTEGVAYWQYGLMNFVVLAEMLYARSEGALNLLGTEQMQRVAAYPAKMQLSGSHFASFSDCHETVEFNPGFISRLALRTDQNELLQLLAQPAQPASDWRLTTILRNLLWWDGTQPEAAPMTDSYLPAGATARLVSQTKKGTPIAVAIKAGHNAENHNQNDIGSFIVSIGGENLLTDPGPGLYSRQYFGPERYENVFANSYGHSVPRIAGKLQGTGREYIGKVTSVSFEDERKQVEIDFAQAYPVNAINSARRRIVLQGQEGLGEDAGTIWVEDRFAATEPVEVEEAFITWSDVELTGPVAKLSGHAYRCQMTIEVPAGAEFKVEQLEEQSKANAMHGVLKRLTFTLPIAAEGFARIRIEVS